MPDTTLVDVRRTLVELSESILRLPEARLSRLPPAAREAVGALIRACDSLITILSGRAAQDPEAAELLSSVRAQRRLLFLVMAEATPDQVGLWTERDRVKERSVDEKIAAGLIPRLSSDQNFEATLRAQWLGEDER